MARSVTLLLIVVATCSVSAFTVQPLPQHISTQRSSSSRLPPPIALAKKKKGGGGGGGGAKVQCVLLADVKGVGRKGELVVVKPAYAENMLIRTGLGEKATPDILEKLATEKAEADAAAVAAKQAAVETNEKLIALFKENGAVLKKKANPDSGQIFGKITPTEVCVRARRGLGSRFIIISPSAFVPLSLSARSQVAELLQERRVWGARDAARANCAKYGVEWVHPDVRTQAGACSELGELDEGARVAV